MEYEGMVIRPPSEADSLIVQVTLGCSHNRCTFCGAYQDKKFRVRSLDEIRKDTGWARRHLGDVRRVFLADGDALVLDTTALASILDLLSAAFPSLARVGIYANAGNILSKSDADLRRLREKKLGIAYLGLESGDDAVLGAVKKGATAGQMVEAVQRAQAAGIKMSVIALLGLAGRAGSERHAIKTAEALNAMQPRFVSFLTVMLIPGTPLHRQWQRGEFEMLSPAETLRELKTAVERLELTGSIFRSDHASNYVALEGRLPKDKARLLAEMDACPANGRLRPEFLRAL
ncbi:MAG: radical SAM protein [Planctomycetes bacterium]|nr:radical SAM protein [Planctomycetota bacterium]